jgi:hypothetical protein
MDDIFFWAHHCFGQSATNFLLCFIGDVAAISSDPCRVKSFRKSVSTVKDDLETDVEIIENFNLIIKLGN